MADIKDANISRFWEKYIYKTNANGVRECAQKWYVDWVERYIRTYPGELLATHLADYAPDFCLT